MTEISVKNLKNDVFNSVKELSLVDLSVYWNYGTSNEFIMSPVDAKIEIHKDKNPAPLHNNDPRFKARDC
jgi:hypothetical protein